MPQAIENYLISPAFFLVDDWTNLSWYSASRHAPIYLDGYSVVASTTGRRREDFTDTLFRAAQWIGSNPNPTTDSPVPVFNNHRYSEGWVHGYDGTYLEIDGDSLNWRCVLQPHTVSLSQYEGMNVRIAFVHDSDDDNIISLDKILLRGTKIIGLEEEEALRADLYPNPAAGRTHLRFTTEELSACTWKLHDLQGKVVSPGHLGTLTPVTHTVEIDLAGLSSGTYLLHYQAGSASDSQEIIVH